MKLKELSNTPASSDTARQLRNLHTLLEVSKAMAREVRLDNLLQVIMEKTTEIMEADRSSLFLYDESSNELWSKIAQVVPAVAQHRGQAGRGHPESQQEKRRGIR